MRINRIITGIVLGLIAVHPAFSQASRVKTNIDFDWYFHLGDITNGQSAATDNSQWRRLDLPHDFSIEGSYQQTNPAANAFLPGGTGWYRKTIRWETAWKNKEVSIVFDGVYMNSEVWINGHYLGKRPNGYIGFKYDLTPYLKNGENAIAVKVDNSRVPSARWYTGSGIYRHVWLLITNPIHLAWQGSFVRTPEVNNSEAAIHLDAQIKNGSGSKTKVVVTSIIINKVGKEITRHTSEVSLDTGSTAIAQKFIVKNPALWSPETPVIYYLKTIIKKGGQVLDNYTTPFGIRKIEFSPAFGFRLNGKPTKFKGVCDHQDAPPVGAAMPEEVLYSRLKLLKAMGCNAIRTSHNPRSPEFYAMCDTMGFMVMDEAFDGWDHPKAKWDYGNYWKDWWKTDLEDFIKRDRNHPCVVIWSQGNEVPDYHKELNVQEQLYNVYHAMDSTRPVTQAWALDKYLDVAGFNANGEEKNALENFHKKYPDRPAIGTEIPHTRQTRGVYRTQTSYYPWDKPEGWETGSRRETYLSRLYPIPNLSDTEIFKRVDPRYASGYDNQTRKISVREEWKQVLRYNFYMGDFRWTGFDYLGESWGWPARTNNYGIIDLAGFPKDDYYLYQSLWTTKPMIHLLPHWTHPGMEGVKIPIVIYTNQDAAELFLNGRSLGKKRMDKDALQIVWQVPYQPGTLAAVAYRDGKIVARDSSLTAAAAAGIRLSADKRVLRANRRDVVQVTADIMDAHYHFVPTDSEDTIHFEVTGPYKLLGVENGDILDTAPQKVLWRKVFMGKALLMLQATGHPGIIHIRAVVRGLKPAGVLITIK